MGRLIVALLVLLLLFILGFAVGALWAGGSDSAPAEPGSTTIDVDVPVATITETFAEVTETVVVTG